MIDFSPNYPIHSAFIPSNIINGNGSLSIKFTNIEYNSGRLMGIVETERLLTIREHSWKTMNYHSKNGNWLLTNVHYYYQYTDFSLVLKTSVQNPIPTAVVIESVSAV